MDLDDLMKKAAGLQRDVERVKERLTGCRVEGTAGGGMVVAVCSGDGRLSELRIDPQVVDKSDVPMLQDLVIASVNQALRAARALADEEMRKVAGGIRIPGLP